MVRILELLEEFLKNIEEDNPFGLVLKGGTALSLYYLDHHRESEDLDFDVEKSFMADHEKIKGYLIAILADLKRKGTIENYKISKSGFASTDRYHMKLELTTYKTFYTKIDIDFVELPKNMDKKGELNLYPIERIFITKAAAFMNRKEFKDLYDIAYLIDKIDKSVFKINTYELINELVEEIQQEDIKRIYKTAFRNVDLRFKGLNESGLERFTQNLIKKLNILSNELRKCKT